MMENSGADMQKFIKNGITYAQVVSAKSNKEKVTSDKQEQLHGINNNRDIVVTIPKLMDGDYSEGKCLTNQNAKRNRYLHNSGQSNTKKTKNMARKQGRRKNNIRKQSKSTNSKQQDKSKQFVILDFKSFVPIKENIELHVIENKESENKNLKNFYAQKFPEKKVESTFLLAARAIAKGLSVPTLQNQSNPNEEIEGTEHGKEQKTDQQESSVYQKSSSSEISSDKDNQENTIANIENSKSIHQENNESEKISMPQQPVEEVQVNSNEPNPQQNHSIHGNYPTNHQNSNPNRCHNCMREYPNNFHHMQYSRAQVEDMLRNDSGIPAEAVPFAMAGAASQFGWTIFVGNLNPNVTNYNLRSLFSFYGDVYSAKVKISRRYGFVTMSVFEDALSAVNNLQGYIFFGREIIVSFKRYNYYSRYNHNFSKRANNMYASRYINGIRNFHLYSDADMETLYDNYHRMNPTLNNTMGYSSYQTDNNNTSNWPLEQHNLNSGTGNVTSNTGMDPSIQQVDQGTVAENNIGQYVNVMNGNGQCGNVINVNYPINQQRVTHENNLDANDGSNMYMGAHQEPPPGLNIEQHLYRSNSNNPGQIIQPPVIINQVNQQFISNQEQNMYYLDPNAEHQSLENQPKEDIPNQAEQQIDPNSNYDPNIYYPNASSENPPQIVLSQVISNQVQQQLPSGENIDQQRNYYVNSNEENQVLQGQIISNEINQLIPQVMNNSHNLCFVDIREENASQIVQDELDANRIVFRGTIDGLEVYFIELNNGNHKNNNQTTNCDADEIATNDNVIQVNEMEVETEYGIPTIGISRSQEGDNSRTEQHEVRGSCVNHGSEDCNEEIEENERREIFLNQDNDC